MSSSNEAWKQVDVAAEAAAAEERRRQMQEAAADAAHWAVYFETQNVMD